MDIFTTPWNRTMIEVGARITCASGTGLIDQFDADTGICTVYFGTHDNGPIYFDIAADDLTVIAAPVPVEAVTP